MLLSRHQKGACGLLCLSVVVFFPWLFAGCAHLPVEREARGPVIAVMINRTWVEQDPRGLTWEVRKEEQTTEERYASCVRQAAAAEGMSVRVITGSQFRAEVFPDFDPRAAPRSLEALRLLMPDPRFQARIQASSVDYLAILGGDTRTSESKGGIVCGSGYGGGGGCLGVVWWDHESHLSALVVDLRKGTEWLSHGIDATGTSWFAMLAILPLAAPSPHEMIGCKRFGEAVMASIRDVRSPEN